MDQAQKVKRTLRRLLAKIHRGEKNSRDQLVFSWSERNFSFVIASKLQAGRFLIKKYGTEKALGIDDLVPRLYDLGLSGLSAIGMVHPCQYKFLQMPAPATPVEEMKSAARYQIKEMLDIDDFTVDILQLGQSGKVASSEVFAAVVSNDVIKAYTDLVEAMSWDLGVIDVWETSQRNLQIECQNLEDSAGALLTISNETQAVLTISHQGEIYHSRRLELPAGLLTMDLGAGIEFFDDEKVGFIPVEEYIPGAENPIEEMGFQGDNNAEPEKVQKVLLEIQRTLDLWGRSWSGIPMSGLQVFTGESSKGIASWLSQGLGQVVSPMGIPKCFEGIESATAEEMLKYLPLLGVLLRTKEAAD